MASFASPRPHPHGIHLKERHPAGQSINPGTGAAEDGALFTYEAIPRGAVLVWDVTCRDRRHFREGRSAPTVTGTQQVHEVVANAHPLLAALGIGSMGTPGMGRLEVLAIEGAQ